MKYRKWAFSTLLLIALTLTNLVPVMAQYYCDPALTKLSMGPLGYKARGDRCEGLYMKEVGTTVIQVASFTRVFEKYNLRNGKALRIQWNTFPSNIKMNIRAQSLKRKLYYRMDTTVPVSKGNYYWPTGILASLNIQKKDIGVTGFYKQAVDNVERIVFVPLSISQDPGFPSSENYLLTVMPGVELKEVFISLAKLKSVDSYDAFIKDGDKLGYGYYPAGRSIEIPLKGLNEGGIYYLEIASELKSGGTQALEFWFYLSGS